MREATEPTQRVREEVREFRERVDSLMLATLSPEGVPEASSAPTVRGEDGAYYIFISSLARHTVNLRHDPRAGILFVEPAEAAPNAFARRRLSFDCRAETVARDSPRYAELMSAFSRHFGNIVETLQALPDFQLVRLQPVAGTYIRGFGQAWRLGGPSMDDPEHINPASGRNA